MNTYWFNVFKLGIVLSFLTFCQSTYAFAKSDIATGGIELLRLRLDSETFTLSSTTLIGFTDGATPGFDPGFDSPRLNTTISIFSVLSTGEQLAIQGREPFDPVIEIDLGFATQIVDSEVYTISIDLLDGAGLSAVNVFLVDNLLNTTTNLGLTDYSFSATESTQLGRFRIFFEVLPSPGGVSTDLSYWLKADAGVTQSSGDVSSWDNQAFGSSNAITQGMSTLQPDFNANALNFNPAISFDGANDFLTTTEGWDSNTQIIVFNPTQVVSSLLALEIPLAYDLPGAALADAGIGVGNAPGLLPCPNTYFFNSGDNDLTSPEYIACLDDALFSSAEPFLATVRQNAAGTFSEHRLWGADESPTISNPGEYGIHSDRPFSLGRRHNGGFQYEGDIVEVISYSSRIEGTDLNKIESYLGIKYGITLDQGMAQSYLNSMAAEIYDADGTLDSYDQHIAGIGRDDASVLNQKQSTSIHSGTLVTIGHGNIATDNASNTNNFDTDLSFMLWGNNGGTTTFDTLVTLNCGILDRMGRVWAVQETGTVDNVRLSIPQSAFTTNIPSILLSNDTTFDMQDTLIVLNDDGQGNYVANFNFTGISYFTFGQLNGLITEFDGMGATGWTNGVPTTGTIATISADYDTAVEGASINACSCQIESGQTVAIRDGDFMNIFRDIVVDGTLIVENAGSIVQVDANAITINNGIIQVNKTTPSLNPRDFTILSNPMSSGTRAVAYNGANRVFAIDGSLFTPDPTVTAALNFLDVDGDYFSPATMLNAGEGYLVFPQAVTAPGAVSFPHTYNQGTLNSGNISKALIYNGPVTANNFNLMGNPYASSIDISTLITNNAVIDEVYFWEHITEPNENLPGFNNENFSMDDISIRNQLGGIAAVNGGAIPSQFMTSGQGFAILANQSGSGAGIPLVFTNAMRVTGNNGTPRSAQIEVDKLWLNVKSSDFTAAGTTLIGFTPEATSALDSGYDSKRLSTTFSLFSTLDDGTQLGIQAREAFDESMEIDMGFETMLPESLSYTIGIDQWEGGNLDETHIFLIDNAMGIVTDLKANEYTFTASQSIQPNRFKVVFDEQALSTEDELSPNNQIRIFPNPAMGQITISSQEPLNLNTAKIYNIRGQKVLTIDLADFSTSKRIDINQLASGLYIVQFEGLDINQVYRLLVR